MHLAVVIEDQFTEGRWLLCRKTKHGLTTVVSDHCDPVSAERERRRLQGQYDFESDKPPVDPDQPRQLVLGFYGPEQGDL